MTNISIPWARQIIEDEEAPPPADNAPAAPEQPEREDTFDIREYATRPPLDIFIEDHKFVQSSKDPSVHSIYLLLAKPVSKTFKSGKVRTYTHAKINLVRRGSIWLSAIILRKDEDGDWMNCLNLRYYLSNALDEEALVANYLEPEMEFLVPFLSGRKFKTISQIQYGLSRRGYRKSR